MTTCASRFGKQHRRLPVGAFDAFQPVLPEIPPLPPIEFRIAELQPEVWPHPLAPEPDFRARGMTEARCVYMYHYGRTIDENLDALQHLTNICLLKSRRQHAYFNPHPFLRFTGAITAWKDWENTAPDNALLQKQNTRGWFLTNLPDLIDKYSPQHITKRELLELARMRDPSLLHTCHALVRDLQNEGVSAALHEISTSRMWTQDGQEFYFDARRGIEIQPTRSITLSEPAKPEYASAAALLVHDKKLRAALPTKVRQTLELVFRKLDAGWDAEDIIDGVSADLNRNPRTVRRHLKKAREIAADLTTVSGQLMQALARVVIPDSRETSESSHSRASHSPELDFDRESENLY